MHSDLYRPHRHLVLAMCKNKCSSSSSSHHPIMDATNNNHARGRKQPSAQPGPALSPALLMRSRSGAPTSMMIDAVQLGLSSSQRYNSLHRSRSTTKSSSQTSSVSPVSSSSSSLGDNGLRRRTLTKHHGIIDGSCDIPRRARTAPPSPSAWTRSPGRGPLFNIPISNSNKLETTSKSAAATSVTKSKAVHNNNNKSSGPGGISSINTISKVLKYFRPSQNKKKVSQEAEELHRLRMLHNRLLQWRFANARAEAAMLTVKKVALERLVSVWMKTNWELRQTVMEKQIEMQKVMDLIKLHEVVMPQIYLLQEWAKLEMNYGVGLTRIITKLSAFSCLLPLLHGTKADVDAVKEAIAQASQVMGSLNIPTFIQFFHKAEKMHHLLTETSQTLKQEWELLQVVENVLPDILPLMEREECLRVVAIQLAEAIDARRGNEAI